MALTAQDIIDRARDILQDTTAVRWTTPEVLRWISDGQREVVLYRPEASVKNDKVKIFAGKTKQGMLANGSGVTDAMRLLDIVRNLGVNGETPGRAIRIVAREVMDAQSPDWHVSGSSGEVIHYMHDGRDPLTFYVWPAPATDTYVESVYSVNPPALASTTQALSIPDIFVNVLVDYTVYRAYLKDSEYAGNANRAIAHYQAFANALGIKGSVDANFGPSGNSALNPNYPMRHAQPQK